MVIYVICFPLNYKLNTGISSVYVFKRTSGIFHIRQGQHRNKSPPNVGFDFGFLFLFCNVNVKFCNSGVCISTSKWDSDMYMYRTF